MLSRTGGVNRTPEKPDGYIAPDKRRHLAGSGGDVCEPVIRSLAVPLGALSGDVASVDPNHETSKGVGTLALGAVALLGGRKKFLHKPLGNSSCANPRNAAPRENAHGQATNTIERA
jgi:hypothetical protein